MKTVIRNREEVVHSKHIKESARKTVLFLLFVLFTVLAFI